MIPFVYVQWQDASHPTTGEWILRADLGRAPSSLTESGGFLVQDDAQTVRVAVSVSGRGTADEQYTGIMSIPKSCVDRIVEFPTSGGAPKVIFSRRVRKK